EGGNHFRVEPTGNPDVLVIKFSSVIGSTYYRRNVVQSGKLPVKGKGIFIHKGLFAVAPPTAFCGTIAGNPGRRIVFDVSVRVIEVKGTSERQSVQQLIFGKKCG